MTGVQTCALPISVELAEQFIDTILSNVRIRVGNEVTISDGARTDLLRAVTRPEDLAHGGRGITTALENRLTNPLGRALFGLGPGAVTITGIGTGRDDQPVLEFDRR